MRPLFIGPRHAQGALFIGVPRDPHGFVPTDPRDAHGLRDAHGALFIGALFIGVLFHGLE